MLISPTEPAIFRTLGKVSGKPEQFGCDFLIVAGGKRIGVQRKRFPEDLIASLHDNRLYEQLQKMQKLDQIVFVMEGLGKWTSDGELIYRSKFNKSQMYGLFFSLAFVHGCQVFQVRSSQETITILQYLEAWCQKPKHTSLFTRSGPKKDSWGKVGKKQNGMHFLQSFQGVGPGLAEKIYDHFGGVPLKWDMEGPENLAEVRGIGADKANRIWNALEKEITKEK